MQQASRLGGRDRHAETRPSPQPRSASGTKDNFGQPHSPSLAVRSLAWLRLPARTDHGGLPMSRPAIAGLPNADVAGQRQTRSANLAGPDGPQVPRSVLTPIQRLRKRRTWGQSEYGGRDPAWQTALVATAAPANLSTVRLYRGLSHTDGTDDAVVARGPHRAS